MQNETQREIRLGKTKTKNIASSVKSNKHLRKKINSTEIFPGTEEEEILPNHPGGQH